MVSKIIKGSLVGAALLLAVPAMAASIPTTTIFDGQTQVWGNAGQSVTATLRVHVNAGEVVHAVRTKVDSQATVCTIVGPYEGEQDVDVPVTITLPPNSNTSGYNLTAELFTTATVPQAEAMTGNLACTGANTNAYNGTNVVHVLPTSGSTTGGTGTTGTWQDAIAALNAQLAALIASITHPTPAPTPTPTTSAVCTAYAQANVGTQGNVYNDANVRLQGFLLSQGASIPALKAGASFGFYGNQTTAAVGWFNSTNHCN